MQPARIAELLDPFLGPEDLISDTQDLIAHISTYIDLLIRWNTRVNLTAIRDPEEIVTRHFGESLFAARHLFPRENREGHGLSRADARSPGKRASTPASTIADLGSGAGFPGLPIKLWSPHISLTLIESNLKKVAFLREVTRALTLTDVNILAARAESQTGITFDVVTLRAVERFETILPTAAGLVAPTGRMALLIGSAQIEQARVALPNFYWSDPHSIPLSRSRVLVTAQRLQ